MANPWLTLEIVFILVVLFFIGVVLDWYNALFDFNTYLMKLLSLLGQTTVNVVISIYNGLKSK